MSENFEKDEKLSHPPLFSLHRHIRTEENKHIYEHKTHRFIKKTRKEREVSLDEMMRSDEMMWCEREQMENQGGINEDINL